MPEPTRTDHRKRVRRQPLRLPGVVGIVAACALVVAMLTGCSDDPGPVPDGSSIGAALRLVPDTKAARSSVLVTIYGRADRASGIREGVRTKAQELSRVARLQSAGVPGGDLGPNPRSGEQYGRLAYRPSDVVAEVVAGGEPPTFDAAVGTFDTKEVLAAAARTKSSAQRKVRGTEVVRWLDDATQSPALDTPVGDVPGQAGRLAFTSDGVLAYAHTDQAMNQMIDAGADEKMAMSTNRDLNEVAQRLDAEEVYAAFLSDTPVLSRLSRSRSRSALPAYRAIGVGAAGTRKRLRVVVVLVHSDKRTAAESLRTLRRSIATGIRFQTGQPWASILRRPRLVQHDGTVVATFDVDSPMLWQQLIYQGEPLLTTR